LARATGNESWLNDERFATVLARHEHQDALDEAITAWTSARSAYDAMHALQAAGVTASAVLDGRDALFDPHFAARGQFDTIDQPLLGKRRVGKHLAARFTRFETGPYRASPLLGEHNEEVLRELGYGDEEIAKLKEERVIANEPALPVPGNLVSMALKLPYDRFVEHGIIQRIDPDYREQLGIAD
jgi:formyl-CoA transferase